MVLKVKNLQLGFWLQITIQPDKKTQRYTERVKKRQRERKTEIEKKDRERERKTERERGKDRENVCVTKLAGPVSWGWE